MRRRPDFRALERTIGGVVVPREAANYFALRDSLTWNARKPMRSPAAIVSVASVEDVSRSVRFAREHGLKVAVRGSGHNYFGAPVQDNCLLLDLEQLRQIKLSATQGVARLQPAVKGGAFLSTLIPFRLAFPVGHSADVGLGGFMLAGGMGWNLGQWGPSCASVRSVEVVSADGELIHASADRSADLFWAARGAGRGFSGVVTQYEVDVHPLPVAITVEAVAFDMSSLEIVAPWLDAIIEAAPVEVEIRITLGSAQDAQLPVSSPALAVSATVFTNAQDANTWMSCLLEPPEGAVVISHHRHERIAYGELLREEKAAAQRPRMVGDAFWSNATMAQLLAAVRPLMPCLPSEHSYLLIQPMKTSRTCPDAAFSTLGSVFIGVYSYWQEAARDRQCNSWIAAAREIIDPLSTGGYVGETDLSVGTDRARRCFTAAAWERLLSLKRRYDPENIFFGFDGA